jgi:hypothetical protein
MAMNTRRLWKIVPALLIVFLAACGNAENADQVGVAAQGQIIDACTLLTQEEVDTLFGEPIGPGRVDSPHPRIQGCVWPAEGLPRLMLQVMPAPASVRESIDPGTGYRVVDLSGMSGEAAVAVQLADPRYGMAEGVAILGVSRQGRMVTLSPVHLDIREGTPDFDRIKEIADSAALRL